jgi:hypothetical protein
VFYERTYEWKGSLLRSPWWLIAKGETDNIEVFTLDGGSILPVFSAEDEAGMYHLVQEGGRGRLGGTQKLLRGADVGTLRTMLWRRGGGPRPIAGDYRGAVRLAHEPGPETIFGMDGLGEEPRLMRME